MDTSSIIDRFIEFPLFRGVSRDRIMEAVGKAKFHFLKYLAGGTIAEPGTPMTHLAFVLGGSVRSTVTSANGRFSVSQTLDAPAALAPEYLFGHTTAFPAHIEAIDTVSIVQISKGDYLKILAQDQIFLLNYLNYLAMNAQKSATGVLTLTTGEIARRLAYWITSVTQSAGRDIELHCKARDLYAVMGVQRSTYMASLEEMVNRGLIAYEPGKITVLDRRALKDLLA